MSELRDYQVDLRERVSRSLAHLRRIIACAATGSGKTKLFIDIAQRAHAKGKTVLVLSESVSIFQQISSELSATLINPEADTIFVPEGRIYIAMAQTLVKRLELVRQFVDMGERLIIIVDEAHIGTFNALLLQLLGAMIIGFTATPDARWAKHLPDIYKGIVVGAQPEELIQKGWLRPYKHFARVGADLDLLSISKGDFNEESQEAAFGNKQVFDGLVDDLRKTKYRKCMIFTSSVKDCELVYEQLTGEGFKCVRYHRTTKIMTDKQQKYYLSQFMDPKSPEPVNICVSVGTLTKGFDFPAIDLIILRRATTSLPLFLQMCGRGSRNWNEFCKGFIKGVDEEKISFTVLDYGGNYLRHGLWYFDREWQDLWNKPRKQKDGVAAIKICPQCEYIAPSSSSVCPNCGYAFQRKDLQMEEGKLIEITEMYNKSCVGKTISELTPEELSVYAKFKNKKNFAARIAKARNQDNPESQFLKHYAECMGYKPGWVDFASKHVEKDEHGVDLKISYPDFILK